MANFTSSSWEVRWYHSFGQMNCGDIPWNSGTGAEWHRSRLAHQWCHRHCAGKGDLTPQAWPEGCLGILCGGCRCLESTEVPLHAPWTDLPWISSNPYWLGLISLAPGRNGRRCSITPFALEGWIPLPWDWMGRTMPFSSLLLIFDVLDQSNYSFLPLVLPLIAGMDHCLVA